MQYDGGPVHPGWAERGWTPGMTLRDYFAAQALAGVMAATETFAAEQPPARVIAAAMYEIADAMLAARKESSDGG